MVFWVRFGLAVRVSGIVLFSFVLGVLAYASLGIDAVLRAGERPKPLLTQCTAALATVYVLLLWHYRYGWSLDAATERGSAAFALFHVVWFLVVIAAWLPRDVAARVVPTSFAFVSVAALPAPFRYEGLEAFRIPVVAVFVVCLIAIGTARARAEGRATRNRR